MRVGKEFIKLKIAPDMKFKSQPRGGGALRRVFGDC